jgi:hypothetical protein
MCSKGWFAFLCIFAACGSSGGGTSDTGTYADATAPEEVAGDAAVADTAIATDTASGEDAVAGPTYHEPTAGVTWTVSPVANMKNRDEAVAACSAANVDGQTGWRLPTVDEARGLYRDCPDLEKGGTCKLGAGCLDSTCNDASCRTCQTPSSQPAGQCKAVQAMQKGWDGAGWYWTSDSSADNEQYWVYNLCQGAFNSVVGGSLYDVRCVK